MNIKVIKIKDGGKNCGICKGTGYYTTYTDRANEDGGEYTNSYSCQCNKKNSVQQSLSGSETKVSSPKLPSATSDKLKRWLQ